MHKSMGLMPSDADVKLIALNLTKEEAEQLKREAQSCSVYHRGEVQQANQMEMAQLFMNEFNRNVEAAKAKHAALQAGADEALKPKELGSAVKGGSSMEMITAALPYLAIGAIIYLVMSNN